MTATTHTEIAIRPEREKGSDIVNYYSEAGQDYELWNDDFNMHFGYIRSPMEVFNRAKMVDNMNDEVIGRLRLNSGNQVLDMGCGLGATMRWGALRNPNVRWTGLTIVDWQVEQARRRNMISCRADNLEVLKRDYTRSGLPSDSFDAAYSLEAACHCPGADKAAYVKEAARILKPGGRLVVADGFRTDAKPMHGLKSFAYKQLCKNWALPELANIDAFRARLEAEGFEDVQVNDVSWRVAPSVAHVPWVTFLFILKLLSNPKELKLWRLRNAFSSLLTMLVGLYRSSFSYAIVTATKRREPQAPSPLAASPLASGPPAPRRIE